MQSFFAKQKRQTKQRRRRYVALRAGLYAGWELLFVRPQLLLIENIKLKLRTKVESCLSSPIRSLDLQLADVCWSCPTCIKPNVGRSFLVIELILEKLGNITSNALQKSV